MQLKKCSELASYKQDNAMLHNIGHLIKIIRARVECIINIHYIALMLQL